MYSITTFSELMKGLPRGAFDKLVRKHNADKYCKKFRHWDHLVSMTYAQLSGASGLKHLSETFNAQAAHHYHLGTREIARSTVADANERRSSAVFSETVTWLMSQVSNSFCKDREELKYLLDSTSITLKGREFERWTADNKTRNTQGIKLHVLLDSRSSSPAWIEFSAANVNDVELVDAVPLQQGALYVFDKGYCDYNWWQRIDDAGGRFVTRFKKNAALITLEERDVPLAVRDSVLHDRIVQFKRKFPGGSRVNRYTQPLRYLTVVRPDKATPLILATNDFESSAAEIARCYKDRWEVELFFKWIKQHLKIKKFYGRTENAVRLQILTALISYLLVALYKQRHAIAGTLWQCLATITAQLFQRPATERELERRRRQKAQELNSVQPCLFQ